MSIPFFNNKSTSRSVFALNTADSEVLVNYKLLDLQVLFPWPQESSQSNIRVKRYDQNNKTGQSISMPRFFPSLAQTNFSLSFYVSTYLSLIKFFKRTFSIDIQPWILPCLHVCMSSSLVLISCQYIYIYIYIYTRNEYILEKLANSHIYV